MIIFWLESLKRNTWVLTHPSISPPTGLATLCGQSPTHAAGKPGLRLPAENSGEGADTRLTASPDLRAFFFSPIDMIFFFPGSFQA